MIAAYFWKIKFFETFFQGNPRKCWDNLWKLGKKCEFQVFSENQFTGEIEYFQGLCTIKS